MSSLNLKNIFIIIVLSLPIVSYAYNFGKDGVVNVEKVTINNQAIVDFIRERVFWIADSVIAKQRPYIQYRITFQKNTSDSYYPNSYYAIVSVIGEEEEFPDWGYHESIEKGDPYNAAVTFIDGRKIKVYTKPDNPYIKIDKERIPINQKFKFSLNGKSITWFLIMRGDQLIDVCLDQEISPDITLDKTLRKDSYLLPKTSVEKPAFHSSSPDLRFELIYPPVFITYIATNE